MSTPEKNQETTPETPVPYETITEKEARFEAFRQRSGLILAPLVFAVLWFLPLSKLSPEAHKLAAVLGLVVTLWITEALPLAVTGLLAPTLVIGLGIAPAKQAFESFADPIMFLFIGAFILTRAIYLHGLDRRFAYWILTNPWVGERPSRILFAYGFVCCFISMWISNTATAAMMFPIGIAIISTLRKESNNRLNNSYASAIMLMCAFAASIGGLATPVGTPTNLIGLGFIDKQLHRQIFFFEWMAFAMPIVIGLFLLLFGYLNFLCPSGITTLSGVRARFQEERQRLGPLSAGERNTMIAFGITVLLWITPGILALTKGETHPWTVAYGKHVPESVAALVGACLLFLLPTNWKEQEYTITVKQAVEIDWGVMALYGGGIALGQLVFSTKLAETIGTTLTGFIPSQGGWLIAIASGVATLVSELTSNVSSANMVVPVVIALAGPSGLQASVAATMASSLGFMLPISTPTNAIVYSSGYVRLRDMVKYGILLDILGFLVIVFGTLLLVPTR
ncbi:MAG: DASS family sodium-coupled anion symporter [Blastocatellia bacterium]|nr:DASS family sodium-coupled anion symporter [Blastocatellia bacterium]